MAELTKQEIDERIAILKRFKTLLEQQRNKFREYLKILEQQQSSITAEDPEKLLAHTEIEQQVVSNIMSLQKVIVPMTDLYHGISGTSVQAENDAVLTNIQHDLTDLQEKVLIQNEKNRNLLKTHLSQIRTQLNSLKNPYAHMRSVYAQTGSQSARLVEIEA